MITATVILTLLCVLISTDDDPREDAPVADETSPAPETAPAPSHGPDRMCEEIIIPAMAPLRS